MATTYLLRDIPDDLHEAVKARAEREGRTIRWVLMQALQDWTENRWEPGRRLRRKEPLTE